MQSAQRTRGRATSDKRKQLLVYLNPDLIKDLKVAAVQQDSTASAIAGEAISAWLDARGLRGGTKTEGREE